MTNIKENGLDLLCNKTTTHAKIKNVLDLIKKNCLIKNKFDDALLLIL